MLKPVLSIASLAVTAVGLLLLALFAVQSFTDGATRETAGDTSEGSDNVASNIEDTEGGSAGSPEDKTLKLTVPEMKRVENATIPTRVPDEEALRDNVAVRLPGTGLPCEEETNVYIAGHELGYPFTDSFRAFYDLKELQKGDEVYLTDADGTEYTYEIFEILIVQPDDLWVLDPLEGRNIVSLQGSETQQREGDTVPKRVVRAGLEDIQE